MKIYIISKKKGRIYKSEDIVNSLTGEVLLHDEKGAPLAGELYISISDTKNYWAMAASESEPVGLDIEEGSRMVKASSAARLHKSEHEYLSALQPESCEWREEFLSIWTQKEAYMKLRGEGLRMGLSSFSVIDDSKTHSFQHKSLIIGLAALCQASALDYELVETDYDAPFEKSCLDAAADILNIRMHSAAELKKKLVKKGYPEAEIEKAIDKLKDYNYLNDEEYARLRAERLAKGGMAPRRIEAELRRKGLDAETAGGAAENFRDGQRESGFDIAKKLAERTTLPRGEERYAASQKLKAKIARKLSSLGYESSIIYDILEKLKL